MRSFFANSCCLKLVSRFKNAGSKSAEKYMQIRNPEENNSYEAIHLGLSKHELVVRYLAALALGPELGESLLQGRCSSNLLLVQF